MPDRYVHEGFCPWCKKPRSGCWKPGGMFFRPLSVCPSCGHVEPDDEG